MQTVARLTRLAMSDAIGQHDEEARGIEQLSRSEELPRELIPNQACAGAPGAMHDQYCVAHYPVSVRTRLAKGAVVDSQLRQRLSGGKAEITCDKVAFDRWRVVRRNTSSPQRQESEEQHCRAHCTGTVCPLAPTRAARVLRIAHRPRPFSHYRTTRSSTAEVSRRLPRKVYAACDWIHKIAC